MLFLALSLLTCICQKNRSLDNECYVKIATYPRFNRFETWHAYCLYECVCVEVVEKGFFYSFSLCLSKKKPILLYMGFFYFRRYSKISRAILLAPNAERSS